MRIALYVRVSREEMESSLINQKEYIKSLYPNDEVIIYQDFGISGTKISNRKGFIQMLLDAGLKQHFITKNVNDNITMNRKWKIKMYKNDH